MGLRRDQRTKQKNRRCKHKRVHVEKRAQKKYAVKENYEAYKDWMGKADREIQKVVLGSAAFFQGPPHPAADSHYENDGPAPALTPEMLERAAKLP